MTILNIHLEDVWAANFAAENGMRLNRLSLNGCPTVPTAFAIVMLTLKTQTDILV